jgi:aminopeptidase N
MDQFTASTLIPVMFDDGFESSQPVYVEVNDPNQIGSLFSSITYDKGASLLFMLESTVGEINFRDGLRVFLLMNSFK